MYATKQDLQFWLGTYTTCKYSKYTIIAWSQKFSIMPWVELVCINLLYWTAWWTYVLHTARIQYKVIVTCCLAIKLIANTDLHIMCYHSKQSLAKKILLEDEIDMLADKSKILLQTDLESWHIYLCTLAYKPTYGIARCYMRYIAT